MIYGDKNNWTIRRTMGDNKIVGVDCDSTMIYFNKAHIEYVAGDLPILHLDVKLQNSKIEYIYDK